jgi:hypothetical protein
MTEPYSSAGILDFPGAESWDLLALLTGCDRSHPSIKANNPTGSV